MSLLKEKILSLNHEENFPKLVKNLVAVGVVSFRYNVRTGSFLYKGVSKEEVFLQNPDHLPLTVQGEGDSLRFLQILHNNQQGKTSFEEFCAGAAEAGISYWIADLVNKKEVSYFNKYDKLITVEAIPK